MHEVADRFWLCGHGGSYGISNFGMGLCGKSSNDLHAGTDLSIGCVDDAKRHYSTFDHCDRRADVWCYQKLWRDSSPRSKRLQRRLSVSTGRHFLHIAYDNRTVPGELGKIKVRANRDTIEVGIFGRD